MSKIIFTGTSSGYPSDKRACSSFVLDTGKNLYQFDAGEGFSGSALRLHIKTSNISKIFISHMHPDHIVGLFLELQMMYLDKRKSRLDIYLPSEAVEGMHRASEMFYLLEEKFPFKFNFKSIKSRLVFRADDISVYAYPNKHLTGNADLIRKYRKPNQMQSHSYIIKLGRKRILYSGDLLATDDLAGLMRNVNLVITEGMHIDLDKLIELCKLNNVRKLILTHLPDELLAKSKKMLKLAEKLDFRNIGIARDGLTIRI